jgi:DnaJ-like protein
MEEMTERKPRDMSFRSWVDQQIADAQERGVFEDLPGAGQPLDLSGDGDFTDKWLRDYVRRAAQARRPARRWHHWRRLSRHRLP